MATKCKTASIKETIPAAHNSEAAADRVAGAIMGAFIGDALGLGPHWYYDLDELRRVYGEWISGYTDPRPGRYHEGLKAGDLSQTGFLMKLLLQSLSEKGRYAGDAKLPVEPDRSQHREPEHGLRLCCFVAGARRSAG